MVASRASPWNAPLRRVSASLDLLQVRTTMHKASALEENVSQC